MHDDSAVKNRVPRGGSGGVTQRSSAGVKASTSIGPRRGLPSSSPPPSRFSMNVFVCAVVLGCVMVIAFWGYYQQTQMHIRPHRSLASEEEEPPADASTPRSSNNNKQRLNTFVFSSLFGSQVNARIPSSTRDKGSCSVPFAGSAFPVNGVRTAQHALDLRQSAKASLQRELHELLDFGPRVGGTPESPGYAKTQSFIEERMRCSTTNMEANGGDGPNKGGRDGGGDDSPIRTRKWWTAYEETFDTVETPLGRKKFVNYIAEFNGASRESIEYAPSSSTRATKGKKATSDSIKARSSSTYPGHLVLAAHWDSKLVKQGEFRRDFLDSDEVAACVSAGEITAEIGELLLEGTAIAARREIEKTLLDQVHVLKRQEGPNNNTTTLADQLLKEFGPGLNAAISHQNELITGHIDTLRAREGITQEMFDSCIARRKNYKKDFVGAIDSAAPMVVLLEIMKFISAAAEVAYNSKNSKNNNNPGSSSSAAPVNQTSIGEDGDVAPASSVADNSRLALPGFPKITILLFDGEEAFIEWKGDDNTYGARLQAEKWEKDEAAFYNGVSKRRQARNRQTSSASSSTTVVPPYNLLSGVTTFLLLDLVGHAQTTMHNFFHDQTGKQYGTLQRIEQRFAGGVAQEAALDPFWRRWASSSHGTLRGAVSAASPLSKNPSGWAALSAESPMHQLTHTLLQVAQQHHLQHQQQRVAAPAVVSTIDPVEGTAASISLLSSALERETNTYYERATIDGRGASRGGENLLIIRPPVGRPPYFPFEPRGIQSGVDDDHKHFLVRGVPILHLITMPFPSHIWHELSDDEDHLNFDLIYEFTLVLAEYAISYRQDYFSSLTPPRYRSQQRAAAP